MKSFTALSLAALSSFASVNAISIAYDAYHQDQSCKTQDQVTADFNQIYSSGDYDLIRIYGTDCNQVATALQALRDTGSRSKLFAGIYDVSQANAEAQTIIDAVGGDWSLIDTVSVGNEGINDGKYSVDTISSTVGSVKSQLSGAGFGGSVVTVDVFAVYYNQPALCNVGDYVAVNIQAYYDGGVAAGDSGSFISDQQGKVASTCGGKRVVVTEAGWPAQGATNGAAVPSPENQSAAISSLRGTGIGDLFLFSAFNSLWKSTDVERSYGFLGNAQSGAKRMFRRSPVY